MDSKELFDLLMPRQTERFRDLVLKDLQNDDLRNCVVLDGLDVVRTVAENWAKLTLNERIIAYVFNDYIDDIRQDFRDD